MFIFILDTCTDWKVLDRGKLLSNARFAIAIMFSYALYFINISVIRINSVLIRSGARDAIIDAPNRVKLPLKQTKIRSEEFGKQNSSKTRKGAVDHW